MIVNYLNEFKVASKSDFKILLMNKLPDVLDELQKDKKISNLLRSLKNSGIIRTDPNKRTLWILDDD